LTAAFPLGLAVDVSTILSNHRVTRILGVGTFLVGLLLAVRVMFFGVQRRLDEQHLAHRRWPLALAALLVAIGSLLYARDHVTFGWLVLVLVVGLAAAGIAWWIVRRSAAAPSSDPEDDPKYRFQGHVARVVESIESSASGGRIAFDFDGERHEFRAVWTTGDWNGSQYGKPGSEVVIERVEEDLAYVEPWVVVEERL